MPKGRMKAADKRILADLLSRYPTAVVEREAGLLQARRGRGRPPKCPPDRKGDPGFLPWLDWIMVEMRRDLAKVSQTKAARMVAEDLLRTLRGSGVHPSSSSALEKNHRQVARALSGMEEKHREAFKQRIYGGLERKMKEAKAK
jgi:hypothetical protein